MKKPIKEWFNLLPDGIRELAQERLINPDIEVKTMEAAIQGGFIWRRNPTYAFWKNVVNHYRKGYTLPPLPTN